jgi:hypothetical protein
VSKKEKEKELKLNVKRFKDLYEDACNERKHIKDQIETIRNHMKREHGEFNRIKGDLLYKTKREYEEMIRRLENDMQCNFRIFSRHEETKILHDINNLKNGMLLLDNYEEKKRVYEHLKNQLSDIKNKQDVIIINLFI